MMDTLFEEYFRQRSDLTEASKQPRTVIFSNIGWTRALKEEADNGRDHNITHGPSATYCGLHRCIDRDQDAPQIVVTHLTQAEYFYEKRARPHAVKVSFDPSNPHGLPQMEVLGRALTAAQLCDICRAWLDADCQKWGSFERALDAVITEHGRFE